MEELAPSEVLELVVAVLPAELLVVPRSTLLDTLAVVRACASGIWETTSATTPVAITAAIVIEVFTRERRRSAASLVFCARVLMVSAVDSPLGADRLCNSHAASFLRQAKDALARQ